jgi:hypothetical protein
VSHPELVLIDVKQCKISLRLVGFVGKIKIKKIIASMCLKKFMTRIESEITVMDVSSSLVVIRPIPLHRLPRLKNLSTPIRSVLSL